MQRIKVVQCVENLLVESIRLHTNSSRKLRREKQAKSRKKMRMCRKASKARPQLGGLSRDVRDGLNRTKLFENDEMGAPSSYATSCVCFL
mmetsp:Transcript_10397/g.20630  ORF Transcript_10397/g.20630 Transcript_10397/m.20630 type:complete len:90 (-) Transcript_10397:39-308(-)